MAKRTFTLTDWWEQTQPRLIRGFRRGAVLLCLGIGFLIIAVAFVAASADKPEPPWWSLVKWIAWFNKDRNGHLVALITAAISAGSFVLAAWPIWFSQEAAHHRKRHKEVLEKLDALGAQGDVHEQLLRQALSKLDALAGQRVEGEERKKRDEATANLPEAELLLLRAGDFDQASQAMEARIASEDHSAALARAAQWRDAGAIANGIDTAKALQYYENAARLDPGDCWTHIFLSRLHAAAGSTAKAEAAAKAGIAAATNDRDRSGALDMVGNIAVAKGDLTAARKAYEDSLAIAKALSARDPRNTQWKRDLSVSYSQLGDLAVAEGDLPAARKAYEDSLAIAKDLSARDPGNTGWKRDLSVSYDRLGDVARDEGDLTAARKAYEDSLAIRKYLSARDPANTEWKRDLSVSSDRLGDVAVAEGDLPAARKAYEDSLAIRKDLSARDPENTEWKRDLAISYERLGDVAKAEGDLTGARKAWENELVIANEIFERDPSHLAMQRFIAVVHLKLASLNQPDSGAHHEKAKQLLQELKDRGRLDPADYGILDRR